MNPGDQINLTGTGNVLKAFGVYDNTQTPLTLKNVQTFELGSNQTAAAAKNELDFKTDGLSKAATGITLFKLDNITSLGGTQTITTGDGQAVSLSTGASGTATTNVITWAGSTTDASLNLTLAGYQGGSGVTPNDLWVTGAADKTLNINSTTAKNAVGVLKAAATTEKVVITGDTKLVIATDLNAGGSSTGIKSIDASADTGGVDLAFVGATNALFTFTGGAGNDSLRFTDATELSTLTSGAQLDGGAGANSLYVSNATFSAANYTTLGAVKNFQTLGFTATTAYDASQVTGIKQFAIALTNAADDPTITKIQAGSTVTIEKAADVVTLNGDTGVNAITVKLGTADSASFTVGTLKLPETSVALVANGKAGSVDTITNLNNADNSTYTITGANDLTITKATLATAVGSVYDASALTGKLTMIGNQTAFSAGSSLGDVIKGGAGADNITASVNSSILTGGAGQDAFSVWDSVANKGAAAGTTTAGTWAYTTITDLAKGETIQFKDLGTASFTSTKEDVSAAGTLNAAVDIAATATVGAGTSIVKWFQNGGNTYLIEDNVTDTALNAADIVVKLTGLVDLSSSTINTASAQLTYL